MGVLTENSRQIIKFVANNIINHLQSPDATQFEIVGEQTVQAHKTEDNQWWLTAYCKDSFLAYINEKLTREDLLQEVYDFVYRAFSPQEFRYSLS